MVRLWGILKANFRLSIRNNLLLAVLYLLVVPVLRSIENLNEVYSAECLEQSIILIGIFLIVPLNAPEQSKAIQEVVCTKKISHWKILLLRLIMSILLLIIMICLFAGIMVWKNCTFPFVSYATGAVISAMTLGNLGFAISLLSNSVITGTFASAVYFLLNSLGNILDDSIFYLFSMGKGNYVTKIWLFGLSLLMIAAALIYERKKKY